MTSKSARAELRKVKAERDRLRARLEKAERLIGAVGEWFDKGVWWEWWPVAAAYLEILKDGEK